MPGILALVGSVFRGRQAHRAARFDTPVLGRQLTHPHFTGKLKLNQATFLYVGHPTQDGRHPVRSQPLSCVVSQSRALIFIL